MRIIVALGVLLAAASVPAVAANFSGKWTIQGAGGRGAGRGGTALTLNQVGNEVTGTMGLRIDLGTTSPLNEEIWGGKVEGDALSFYVWVGTDQPVKTMYAGTLSASGDEITFTVTRGRGASPGAGSAMQMTARRTK
jgi:hypothetical protein